MGKTTVLGLATGASPIKFYQELVRLHQTQNVSFKNVVTFNLDEYYPMDPAAIQSYHYFMYQNLFNHIDILPKNVHIPNGLVDIKEVNEYCESYESKIDGYGGIDIYVSFKNEKGYWEEAINLGPSINTKGDDQTPFIHADNQSLYFSSNGRLGFGGSDIYVARKKIDGSWTTPINLGYPINTYDNEGSIAVASNGTTAYIASDRADSRGELDIYKITLAENSRAYKTWYIKGQVIDAKTKKTLAADLQIVDPKSGYPMLEMKIDSMGQFLLALPYFDSLGLKINSPGHDYLSSILPIDSVKLMAGKNGALPYALHKTLVAPHTSLTSYHNGAQKFHPVPNR